MKLTILGNSAGGPFQGRHYTGQLLQCAQHAYLIDCGEGTQFQLYHFRLPIDKINQIFISHLHGDHVYGLVGLITSYCLRARTRPLQLFGPVGLQDLIETTFRISGAIPPFPILYHVVDSTVHLRVFEDDLIEVWTIPLQHRTACTGWLFRMKPVLPNIRKEAIAEYQIPFPLIPGIKKGADLHLPEGRVVANALLLHPPKVPLSYAFCSDTAFSEAVVAAVNGVDLLYHEATFMNAQIEEARIAYHSTAAQAAEVARRAGVGRLLLGHFSARYRDLGPLLEEAQAVFQNSELAEEGVEYPISGMQFPISG